MDRIFAICSNESSDTVGRVAMLLWCIWQNRNDKLWNDNVQMPRQIGRHAFDAWNDWYSVHKLHSNNVSGTTEADLVRWEKPALDWVKCNVDVAFVAGSGRTSMGFMCFRNDSGHFMAAMEEARHRGLNRVQFESDSKVLVEAIHMKRRGNSEFLSIVHDILSLMSSFINFEVKFVRRQANLVAHTLARAANSWASFHRVDLGRRHSSSVPVSAQGIVYLQVLRRSSQQECESKVSREPSMAVGKRLKSHDEQLMPIIPMSSITIARGKSYVDCWSTVFGLLIFCAMLDGP
ncbi:hypothetical protein TSUD_399260 [Trifolium subterraneum]|uniref:RNase H type-1 domain-containing protein n=1 Tax=Trifolium subterraneum TaxID=3900 RepID=A0A2Z6P5R5_TRISU|nr:hypothetical protein TSUD_399260 [Trifolium subterraneum]